MLNAEGQLVGVLSAADILIHQRERLRQRAEQGSGADQDPALVNDVMTPAVFSVRPDTPAAKVVAEMVALQVHQLFVVDHTGMLVGVIGTLDVLEHVNE